MAVLVQMGVELPSATLLLIKNAQNNFSIFLWDDPDGIIPSDISTSTVQLELTGLLVVGTKVGSTNEVQFSIAAAQTTTLSMPNGYEIVIVKGSNRYPVLAGKVKMQS